MTDTTDAAATDSIGPEHGPSRLNKALAWVGIVAGGVFIVGAIFLSGYFLNWSEHMHMRDAPRWPTKPRTVALT